MTSDSFTANLFTDSTEESDVQVEFDCIEGQKEILHPADNAQPGIEPSIELTSVKLSGNEVVANLSLNQYEDIVEQAWRYLDGRRDDYDEAKAEARYHRNFNKHW